MRLYHNARIYTLDPHHPFVTAVLIEDGNIRAIGNDDVLLAELRSSDSAIDLKGKTILPGLNDAHIHLEHYAQFLKQLDCEVPTRQECIDRVADMARRTPAGNWILGHGWNHNGWDDGYGCAADLDEVAPDHPVFLTAKSLHASWANSKALSIADIGQHTPDPTDGEIQRNPAGEPTGILFENASNIIAQRIPKPTPGEIRQAIEDAQSALWKLGITGVHDFDQNSCFSALQQLHQEGKLRLRVLKSIPLTDLDHASAVGLHSGFGNQFLRIGSIKMFADGALGQQTAAMLSPYQNSQDHRGMLLLDHQEILNYAKAATQNDLSVAIHAIGDRAVRNVLDALQQLRAHEAQYNLRHLRHRIEHVQNIHKDDQKRMTELDIIGSMQPIHATSDMFMADQYWGDRTANAYALQSLLNLNTRLAFGSDAPVESPNPFWGLHAAVTRCKRNGQPGPDGWHPEQRISMKQALYGFTLGAAYAAGQEYRQGVLSPGFFADMIILEDDPFIMSPEEIQHIHPAATMVGGKWMWKADSIADLI